MGDLRAIGLMVASMACFALSDLFLKFAARTASSAEILLVMSLFGTVTFAVLTRLTGGTVFSPAFFHRFVLIRNLLEVFGSVCIVSALVLAPLSLVSAITQATPLVVTAGAALFLGEHVGPRRWIAVVVGLAGVLLILRPGMGELTTGALFAVGATLGLGGRDVVTRLVPRGISSLQLATYAFSVVVPVSVIMVFLTSVPRMPEAMEIAWLTGTTLCIICGYYMLTAAMRIGDVSSVSPFRYTRLLYALIFGVVFLNERPDLLTLVGAAIVIASGLYVLLRARALSRRQIGV